MPSPTMMKSLRTFTINSLTGHSVNFKANEARLVPAEVVQEAMEKGAVPVDEKDLPVDTPDEQPAGRPDDPKEAFNAIKAVVALVVERNDTEDFTASGTPKAEIVNSMLGWETNAKERTSALKLVKQGTDGDA